MIVGLDVVRAIVGDTVQSAGVPSGLVLDFNLVAFVTGLVSLILGGYAIWLSLRFKEQSDRVAQRTLDLLVEVRTDAKALATFAAGELQKYGEISRAVLGRMSSAVPGTIDTRGGPIIGGPAGGQGIVGGAAGGHGAANG
jgi:hypothetical protein